MTEQTTIQGLTEVARDWGPLWTCVALIIIYHILDKIRIARKRSQYNEADKKRDHEIEKLRIARGDMLEKLSALEIQHQKELADFRVELEKRATYTWMEAKVLPKIDKLTDTVAKFEATVEILVKKCKIIGGNE